MLVVLIGESGAGKSVIEKELITNYGFNNIIKWTTRPIRDNEQNDVDYHFISLETFDKMIKDGEFLEYEEYPQNRYYGTISYDYQYYLKNNDNKAVVTLTPNGYRKLKSIYKDNIIGIHINASLGIRVQRYIDRCGINKFNFDDMNEINARVNRDYGMFLGIDNEVDYTIMNNGKIELSTIGSFITDIVNETIKEKE